MTMKRNAWARYFDECWEQLHPNLPLPYGPTPSPETIMRMHQVRQSAEANATRTLKIRRRIGRWWPW